MDARKRPRCHKCGLRPVVASNQYKGKRYFRKWCDACRPGTTALSRFKKDKCERCGFEAKHSCQLDVDHIDGNHSNNELSNLQTLCANCHRLKTYLQKNEYAAHEVTGVSISKNGYFHEVLVDSAHL